MFPLGEGGQPIVAPAAITTFTPETQIHKIQIQKSQIHSDREQQSNLD